MKNTIHFLKQLVPQRMKNVLFHFPMAVFAAVYFGFPARKLKVIGITGTNGKTTTTQLTMKILQGAGKKVAMASTINFVMDGEETVNTSKFTTLSSWQLERFLHEAVNIGCEYAVIETSSHAIDQYRIFGIPYEIAVMTNVTREHLDYHQTMSEYRLVKRQLFERAKMAVVNLDMESPEEYLDARQYEKKISYSTNDPQATILSERIELKLHGSEFFVEETKFTLAIPGLFNVENALAAIGVGVLLDIDMQTMSEALAKVTIVPGRMESVANNRGITILIDYAVTPDSLEKLYRLVSQMKTEGSRIIALLGACGERDRGKRPMMGEIVSSSADTLILTNEDPYYEDPEQILDDIEKGIVKIPGKEYLRIFDRREAIVKALSIARRNDIIAITGKGAEETMKIGAQSIPWNDARVVREELGGRDEKIEF
ncbi:MAG: UDP-N-acetylmuramoyl-L-alanyl-D-glutamate--2,6-diaminopimelate ligase [Candidatus Moranbacteria bacterium]|nr:UDP-N-acetylmuramoyl-L-alanyl-D-glutamate--2,6-diaminopimelate ligase [Candidatus Moranbacteria bacterium]